jgi:hypothetical protein
LKAAPRCAQNGTTACSEHQKKSPTELKNLLRYGIIKMKTFLPIIVVALALGFTAGCGKSSDAVTTPDPNTQPEAQAALFNRTFERAKYLVTAKDFVQARQTLDVFKEYKLTAEQQQQVDKLKEQIPAN